MHDLFRGWRGQQFVRRCAQRWKILLSTHHIFHYVASDVASYVHLAVLIANLWGKFLSSSQAVPPEGNTSLRPQGSHSNATLATQRTTHAEVSPIGSLA